MRCCIYVSELELWLDAGAPGVAMFWLELCARAARWRSGPGGSRRHTKKRASERAALATCEGQPCLHLVTCARSSARSFARSLACCPTGSRARTSRASWLASLPKGERESVARRVNEQDSGSCAGNTCCSCASFIRWPASIRTRARRAASRLGSI